MFETRQAATNVSLSFNDWVLTSMLRGKKVMHLFDKPGFNYLPGESVIVPPNELMRIDFPEAEEQNPTQCIALAISEEHIRTTINLLNERHTKIESGDNWQIDEKFFHLANKKEIGVTPRAFQKGSGR
ncbi:AraC family transcriptional regulator N-terminal domain-containing protein [Pontibacter harenae]|uniref:AraC family transcriptional regulator N-terminal domain-containing protein n=1 Tax=Pontibacter harenae TaxID=2894083 RepID=UPI003F6FDC1C